MMRGGSGLLTLAKSEEEMSWALGKNITDGFIVSNPDHGHCGGVSWNYTHQLRYVAASVSHTHQVQWLSKSLPVKV